MTSATVQSAPEPKTPEAPGKGKSTAAQVAGAGAWGLAGRAVLLFANLAATPFTIRLLGPSSYGLWTLLQTAATWAMLADVGMSSASTKFGADSLASGDNLGESRIVWSALNITSVTTTLLAVLIGIEAPTIVNHLLPSSERLNVHLHSELFKPGVLALRLVCVLFVAQAIAGTANTPQVIRLRWRQYTILNTSTNLLATIGLPIALVALAGGVVTMAAVGLAAAAVGALGNFLLAVRLQPAMRRPRVHKATMRLLVGYGGALSVSSLATIPLTTAERLFLAQNHAPSVVAYYAVAATLGTTLYVLPEQFVAPLLPALTRLRAEGRLEEHRALYRKALVGMYLLLAPAAILLAFGAGPFLSLWAGSAYGLHSTMPFLIIVVGVCVNCIYSIPNSYLLSSGHTKLIAYIQVAQIAPYLAFAWFMTDRWGAVGAALAWSGRLAVKTVVIFVATHRVAPRLAFSPLSDRRVLSVAAPLGLGAAAYLAATVSHGLLLRLVWAAGLGTVYLAVLWRLVLTARERQGLANLSGEMLAKRLGRFMKRPRHALHQAA
ncbi:MAG: polysaccharide biosynthesis C-terminal domain-containing protein [Acidimicrobiales bacterium]